MFYEQLRSVALGALMVTIACFSMQKDIYESSILAQLTLSAKPFICFTVGASQLAR